MSQLTSIILNAGILSDEALRELKRWRLPVGEEPDPNQLVATPTVESISRAIADAIEGEGYVLTRETDLEAIPQYLKSMQAAVLSVVMEDGESADIQVQVGRTSTGEWIMPWQSETISDLLTNGLTGLKVPGEQVVYFSQARELFYGQKKAFVVCTPSFVEPLDGSA
jgi:hypothetical protein